MVTGVPGSSAGKESTCNAGDPSLIPGLGRSAEEGIGYPLQCSWASLVDQMVKYLSAMRESWVQSLGWEDHLEKEQRPAQVFCPGDFHGQRTLAGYSPWGHKELAMTERLSNFHVFTACLSISFFSSYHH